MDQAAIPQQDASLDALAANSGASGTSGAIN
jgi:hypothetical protein